MRFLEIPSLEIINNALGNVEMLDKSRISIKAEAYSCKQPLIAFHFRTNGKLTQSDRKILRMLNEEYSTESEPEEAPTETAKKPPPQSNSTGVASGLLKDRGNRKTHAYLVGTMNSAFPDYDFSSVAPESFVLVPDIDAVVRNVNVTLFTAGIAGKNSNILAHFNSTLWNCINDAIDLSECVAYSYQNKECDFDVLSDGGCVWSFNYIFFNRKLKRTLLFVCKRSSRYGSTTITPLLDEDATGSITPLPSCPNSQTETNSLTD